MKVAIVYEGHQAFDPVSNLAVHNGVPSVPIGHDRRGRTGLDPGSGDTCALPLRESPNLVAPGCGVHKPRTRA